MSRRFDPDLDHRRSIRLPGHDYTRASAVFVTVCAYQREQIFGELTDEIVSLNDAGEIVSQCWPAIADHFAGVGIDVFVVMPNHLHGVLITAGNHAARARHAVPLRTAGRIGAEAFGRPVPGSVATIMRSFKAAATKGINEARRAAAAPVWQRNYYEHVIADEADLASIRAYIEADPRNWVDDEPFIPQDVAAPSSVGARHAVP